MVATLGAKPFRLLRGRVALNKPGISWFNAVTTALMTLRIRVGSDTEPLEIIRPNSNGTQWEIVIPRSMTGPASSVWSGVYWYGNNATDLTQEMGWPNLVVNGRFIIFNLTVESFRFADTLDEIDDTNEQAFWIADPVYNPEDEEEIIGYQLNHHTQGDIHVRIT